MISDQESMNKNQTQMEMDQVTKKLRNLGQQSGNDRGGSSGRSRSQSLGQASESLDYRNSGTRRSSNLSINSTAASSSRNLGQLFSFSRDHQQEQVFNLFSDPTSFI